MLSTVLEDTFAYYTVEEFANGFLKSLAFQACIIQQNRGLPGLCKVAMLNIGLEDTRMPQDSGVRAAAPSRRWACTRAVALRRCNRHRPEPPRPWTTSALRRHYVHFDNVGTILSSGRGRQFLSK